MYKLFFKRFFDFWIALIALICISPILIVVTIWLHFANKKGSLTPVPSPKGEGSNWIQRWLEPAIFLQERPGKDAKIFKVIKFKTMTDERDAEGNLLPDADRLTKVGRFVRSTSIDELPQLINVLKGDMALIGPRPLLVQWYSICHFILKNRLVGTKSGQVLVAGHSVMDVIISAGRRSSSWTCGMWIMCRS